MNEQDEKNSGVPTHIEKNLRALLKLQSDKKRKARWDIRFVDPIIRIFGSMTFLWVNLAIFIVWITINMGGASFLKSFDPYPFEFLTLAVSLEAIVLSIIVLIGQNELQKDSDERAELDLLINLLAERETTAVLKKLVRIEKHLGIKVDQNETELIKDLLQDTDPINIAEKISQTLRKTSKSSSDT